MHASNFRESGKSQCGRTSFSVFDPYAFNCDPISRIDNESEKSQN